MAFDQPTRNRLARFVGEARALLTEEFTRQLQHEYGLDPVRGEVAELAKLTQLDDARRETARILRDTLAHYLAGQSMPTAKARQEALDRIVREQAFTVLNRLCALRMAEARGLLIESIAKGYQSKGFQLYARLAGTALGETGDGYRTYLFSLFDEFGVDLAVLFDRFSPQGRLFPRASTLLQLLAAINHPDLEPLWAEDETIGWIYQYFNSKEERKAMRDASQAPRNSRELAVRNQFFTPRYVVEFLTDNTLGRIWYEMTQGQTTLVDSCRYLVRRPREVFLRDPAQPIAGPPSTIWGEQAARGDFSALPEEPDIAALSEFSLIIDGYELAERHGYGDCIDWADQQIAHYRATGEWPTSSLELWLILFRQQRYHGRASHEPEAAFYDEWRSAYRAFRQRLQQNELAQEELLRQPVYIPFRPLKDPRTILMLDPACGSMHFGLYSFDLYERIYEEAWEIEGEVGAQAFQRPAAMAPLHERYRDKASFLRDVPRLIIEHNIHGIDIDSRAVQIAGLSLWLRAQRSWQAQGVKPQDRPVIRKSNIVCAEPMPGDKALLEEFLQGLRDDRLEALIRRVLNIPENQRVRATPTMADALCDLVRKVWEEMKLAGEAGSLLKIEKSLAEAIAKGREEWDEKMPLFRVETFRMMEEKPKVNYVKMNVDFWMQAEALVLVALDEYAAQAENGSYHRRLFAEDATRGFAFIDLCRKYYDILLMNPPFGELSKNSKSVVEKIYPSSKGNILAHFIERAADLITAGGKNGVIVSRACFFLTSMSEFRSSILGRCLFVNFFADLGSGVLDAMVETAAVVLSNDKKEYNEAIFFRHLIDEQKDVGLLNSVNILKVAASSRNIFLISPQNFSALSGTPYVYWVTPNIIQNIANHYKLEPHGGMIRVGLQTGDDHRYLRLWLEVDQNKILNAPDTTGANQMRNICLNATMQGKIWTWYSKIDEASPFAASIHLVVNWYKDGREIKAAHVQNGDSISRYVRSEDSYFKPGISYMLRSSRLIPYVVPRGVIPTAGRSQIYPKDGQENWILALSASNMGSAVARFRGESFERPKLQNSMVASVPFVEQPLELKMLINKCLADKLYLQRRNFVADETCIEFINIPRSLIFPEPTPLERSSLLGREIDLQISAAFGLDEIAMATLERDLIDSANVATTLDKQNNDLYLQDDNTDRNNSTDYDSYSAVISYAIGCAFGRWDIEYSTGKKVPLELQDPFTSLPICSPGMLQNAHGLPAIQSDMATDYPIYICWLGVLVDDSSHSEDIEHHIRKVFNVIWPDRTDAIEQEACEILGVSSLRAYFANPTRFFDDHLKRYSKSRRVAPIYWPLSTPSSSYTLWLYYHRLTDQTLYSCVNDFVEPKLKQANEDVDMLRRRANRSRQEEKELTRLSDLALELAAFRDELLRIARFWQPNLNDGVQITAAPLWRLFQHRAWQKRLKETWEALEAGDYDWAHLAYSIWPERVREKCKTDKSLAIAHDLEHLYVEPVKTVKAKKGGRKPQSVDDDEQGELL